MAPLPAIDDDQNGTAIPAGLPALDFVTLNSATAVRARLNAFRNHVAAFIRPDRKGGIVGAIGGSTLAGILSGVPVLKLGKALFGTQDSLARSWLALIERVYLLMPAADWTANADHGMGPGAANFVLLYNYLRTCLAVGGGGGYPAALVAPLTVGKLGELVEALRVGGVALENIWNEYRRSNERKYNGQVLIGDIEVEQSGSFVTTPYRTSLAEDGTAVLNIAPYGPHFLGKFFSLLSDKLPQIRNLNNDPTLSLERVVTCVIVILYRVFEKAGFTKNAEKVILQLLGEVGNRTLDVQSSTVTFGKNSFKGWFLCAKNQCFTDFPDIDSKKLMASIASYLKSFARTAMAATQIQRTGIPMQNEALSIVAGSRSIDFKKWMGYITAGSPDAATEEAEPFNIEAVNIPTESTVRDSVLLSGLPDFAIYVGFSKYVERCAQIISQLGQEQIHSDEAAQTAYERMQTSGLLPSQAELTSGRPDPKVLARETSKAVNILRGGHAYLADQIEKLAVAGGGGAVPHLGTNPADIPAAKLAWGSVVGIIGLIFYADRAKEGTEAISYIESLLRVGDVAPVVAFFEIAHGRIGACTAANLPARVTAQLCNIEVAGMDAFARAYQGNEYDGFLASCNADKFAEFVVLLTEVDCANEWTRDLKAKWRAAEANNIVAISAETTAWYW